MTDSNVEMLHERAKKGSTVVLNKALVVPAQRVRSYLQGGLPVNRPRRSATHCLFLNRKQKSARTQIEPDRFRVTRSVFEEELEPANQVSFITTLTLESLKQPDVLRLICTKTGPLHATDHITYRQFRDAVGEYVALQ